jgi:hypothetical protein
MAILQKILSLFSKLMLPKISEYERESIDVARQALSIYYAELRKGFDEPRAKHTWIRFQRIQLILFGLLEESPNPNRLYRLGSEIQKAKLNLRANHNF